MVSALLVLAIALAALALSNGPLRRLVALERWVLATSGALLALAWLSWLTIRARVFSPWLAAGCLVVLAGSVWWGSHRRDALPAPEQPTHGGARALVVALSAFGALYAFYPTYFLLGGQDPGIYLLAGSWASRTGGLDMDAPWAREAWVATNGAVIPGYPALYSMLLRGFSKDPNHIVAQSMHLFPALSANAWAAGGIEAAVRVNALTAVVALANVFVLCRRLLGWQGALAAVVALGVNPAFIWGARITLTEVLAIWLNVMGLMLLLLAHETASVGWGRAAGAVLGLGVLNRVDAGMSVLAVLAFSLAAAVLQPRLRGAARSAAIFYVSTSALSYLDGRLSTPPYFHDLATEDRLGLAIGLSLGVGVLAAALATVPGRYLERARIGDRSLRVVATLCFVVLLLWVAFALFVRPHFDKSDSAPAARELTWYLTPLVWPLLALGLGLRLRDPNWSRWLPLLVLMGGSLFMYTADTDVAHEHIWASRRWLPQVIPLTLIVAASAGSWLWTRRGPLGVSSAAAALAGLGYLVLALNFARPFLFRSMLSGLPAAYEGLARFVRENAIQPPLVTGDVQLAAILTYMYQTPTMLTAERGPKALSRHELAGRFGVGFGAFELGDVTEYSAPFSGRYLEIVSDHPPRALIDFPLLFSVGRIGDRESEVEVKATHPSLGTLVGRRDANGSVHTTGRGGTLQNGPWMAITPGQYEVDWLGRVWQAPADRAAGMLDVIADGGHRVLASLPMRLRPGSGAEGWLGGLEFSVETPLAGVEFRMRVEPDVGLALTRVRLRRVAAP